jgi:hypothetical protein
MKRKVTLLDRAKADFTTAVFMLKNYDDDLFVDIAAYHAQQCIKKPCRRNRNQHRQLGDDRPL